jgi:hypothetical protein
MKKTLKPIPTILPDDDVAPTVLAQAIVDIAKGADCLLNGPLSRRAVYLLIRDRSGVSLGDIESVLTAAAELKDVYVKDWMGGKAKS